MTESLSTEGSSSLSDVTPVMDVLASSSKPPEALSKPMAATYISHLTTLPLSELLIEPSALQTQSHHLTSSLTSLTHTSYPTFLSLHRTTSALTNSLSSFSTSLDSLLGDSLPALEECAAGWRDHTDTILKERSKARVVLEQHEKIRDLLDIPLLIDTCVWNGYFSEALSLASHANALAANASTSKSSPPLILSSVLSEVHHSITQMLHSLLSTLHESNRKLPALWKAVNFLRKMDAFGSSSPFLSSKISTHQSIEKDSLRDFVTNEEQIALVFLTGRETCLKSSLEPVGRDVSRLVNSGNLDDRDKEDLARYLKKYIDVWREGVYDIISQFSTIFLERQQTLSTNPSSTLQKQNGIIAPSPSDSPSPEIQNLRALIATHATHSLTTHLIPILTNSLPFLSLSLLPSLLTQLTYCATAFARIGMDFSGLLPTVFGCAIVEIVGRELREVGKHWVNRVRKVSGGDPRSGGNTNYQPPSKWFIVPTLVTNPPFPSAQSTISISQGPAHIPPQLLVSYPPLAEYTNGILGILNGLRLLAPQSILPELSKVMDDEVLCQGGEVLFEYLKAVYSFLGSGIMEAEQRERKLVRVVGEVYFKVFLPFVRRALVEGVYGVKMETFSDELRSKENDGSSKLMQVTKDWEGWINGLDLADDED